VRRRGPEGFGFITFRNIFLNEISQRESQGEALAARWQRLCHFIGSLRAAREAFKSRFER
jgi:hypothetical protein